MIPKRIIRTAGIVCAASLLTAALGMPATAASTTKGVSVFFIGGKPTDPFWSIVKKGAEAAGKAVTAAGGSVTWLGPQNYDSLGADVAALIRQAIFSKAQALVVPDWVPAAEDAQIKAAIKAHIPVVIVNAGGIEAAKATGALTYVGTDENLAGIAAGKYFGAHGVKRVLCVNTGPGNSNYESRCAGVKAGIESKGGVMKTLWMDMSKFGDINAVKTQVQMKLKNNRDLDGVITMGADDADSAAAAITSFGKIRKISLGSFDLTNKSVVNRIDAGTQLFAVDQQPYLQGYQATSIVWQYVQCGIKPATSPLLTGPAIVDKSNVHQAKFGSSVGTR